MRELVGGARPGGDARRLRCALALPPHGSAFVLLRPAGVPLPPFARPAEPPPAALDPGPEIGGWTIVAFDGPGAPAAPVGTVSPVKVNPGGTVTPPWKR